MPRSLTDPPAANETVMANITLISLQGNAVDVTPYVYGYNEGINFTFNNQNTFNFTQADYGTQFDVMVKTRGEQVWSLQACRRVVCRTCNCACCMLADGAFTSKCFCNLEACAHVLQGWMVLSQADCCALSSLSM